MVGTTNEASQIDSYSSMIHTQYLFTLFQPFAVVCESLKRQVDCFLWAGVLCAELDVMWVGFAATLLYISIR